MSEIEAHRGTLFAIAYRMLGSASDAEDAVQESFLRYARAAPDEVRSPRAYLSRTVTRVCLDQLKSARVRRELVGASLPEPVAEDADPRDHALLAESLSFAFLRVLQSLSPTERAVFLLREVFELEHAEVAAAVGKSEAATRQIALRARRHLAEARPRFDAERAVVREAIERFSEAARRLDVEAMLEVLAPEVTLWADGGPGRARYGRARAIDTPLQGRERVARFLTAVQGQAPADAHTRLATVNGAPGLLTVRGSELVAAMTFRIVDSKIVEIFIVADPAKLARLGASYSP